MNRQHLQAFFWLRWRLFINQMKRGGIANVVILVLLAAAAVLLTVIAFVASFLVGWLALADASPTVIMYVWDGLVLFFLFWWAIGLITDLQRSEALSLDRFLHLPVSLTSAFLINYLSSLLSFSMVLFLPAMIGLSLGLILANGPAMLLLFPLLAAFLFMVTALTYQLQGWLAALMVNKRRRQTIIVMLTMSLILLCQLPNLVNVLRPWNRREADPRAEERAKELGKYVLALKAGEITLEQYQEQYKKSEEESQAQNKERTQHIKDTLDQSLQLGNLILPPGWLPLGAMNLAEGSVFPALLGSLGLAFIGMASLGRAYRTTFRYYTGQINGKTKRSVPLPPTKIDHSPAFFFEKKLPWLSEQATAIALTSFRSLVRAPEAMMMLMSPIIMVVIFGSMVIMQAKNLPDAVRPLMAFGATAMVLLGMIGFTGNQFGFDRSGFRVYVLSPAPRRDILLGKNLAIAPLTLGMAALLTILLAFFYPLFLDHLLAIPAQMIAMFLVFCLLGNWMSILSPMAIRAGSFKAAHPKGIVILLSLAFVFLFPLAMLPLLLPLGIEALLHYQGILTGMPICLLLSLLEFVAIAALYYFVLNWQGNLLQRREQRILDVVTVKSE